MADDCFMSDNVVGSLRNIYISHLYSLPSIIFESFSAGTRLANTLKNFPFQFLYYSCYFMRKYQKLENPISRPKWLKWHFFHHITVKIFRQVYSRLRRNEYLREQVWICLNFEIQLYSWIFHHTNYSRKKTKISISFKNVIKLSSYTVETFQRRRVATQSPHRKSPPPPKANCGHHIF